MTNILITNVYSYKNKGDAAIVLALIKEIHRVFDDANIVIQTTDPDDSNKYGVYTSPTLLWVLFSSTRNRNYIYRSFYATFLISILACYLLLQKLGISSKKILPPNLNHYILAYEKCDFIIACGGGYIRSSSGSYIETILLFATVFNFSIGSYFRKKIFLYSQSIGPIYGLLQRNIVKSSLSKVEFIEVREHISRQLLKDLKVQKPVYQTADAAFLLNTSSPKNINNSHANTSFQVGITVRHWFKDKKLQDDYNMIIAQTVDYVARKYCAKIYYVPQVIAESFGDDDRMVAKEIKSLVHEKKRLYCIKR